MRLARAQDQALGMSPELTSRVANEYKYLQRKCTELAVVHHSSAELGAGPRSGRPSLGPAQRCCPASAPLLLHMDILWHLFRHAFCSTHLLFKLDECAGGCFQALTCSCLQPLRC